MKALHTRGVEKAHKNVDGSACRGLIFLDTEAYSVKKLIL